MDSGNSPSTGFDLDAQDREALAHLVAAPNQKAAAEWLGTTDRQLRRRLKAIQSKLGADNQRQMVAIAAICGFISHKAFPHPVIDALQPARTPDAESAARQRDAEASASEVLA